MTAPTAQLATPGLVAGYWRVLAYPANSVPIDITFFRGAATKITSMTFSDPGGPKSATIVLPAITIFDKIGQGDLWWLSPEINIDIVWAGSLPPNYPGTPAGLPPTTELPPIGTPAPGFVTVDTERLKPVLSEILIDLTNVQKIMDTFVLGFSKTLLPSNDATPKQYTLDDLDDVFADPRITSSITGGWKKLSTGEQENFKYLYMGLLNASSVLRSMLGDPHITSQMYTTWMSQLNSALNYVSNASGLDRKDSTAERVDINYRNILAIRKSLSRAFASTSTGTGGSSTYDNYTDPTDWTTVTNTAGFKWEGYAASPTRDQNGLTLDLIGAIYQADLHLAKPAYLSRPIPYEVAIAQQFLSSPDFRFRPLQTVFPNDWSTQYITPSPSTPSYLIPTGVANGQRWTGLVTRSTGSWNRVFSDYIVGLLQGMYTANGRWTIDLLPGRQPVLFLRPQATSPDPYFPVVIDLAWPGVTPSLTEDWSQTVNTVYAQGNALSGIAYTGMEVSANGLTTSYTPLAYLRQVEPPTTQNPWFQASRMRKEVMMQVYQGLDEYGATAVSQGHLQRFANPGVVGTITLTVDPLLADSPDGPMHFPRALLKPGMTVQVPLLFGEPEGFLFHITDVDHNVEEGSSTITVDSKYRDALTVQEVLLRGRDSLSVARGIIAGTYQPATPDQLVPWNYADGSGYIPSAPGLSSLPLFQNAPTTTSGTESVFPWTEITTARPPSSPQWRNCYIKIPNANGNIDQYANTMLYWSQYWKPTSKGKSTVPTAITPNSHGFAVPIRTSQAGTIKLLQVAAYDPAGNVLLVPFHVSFYLNEMANYQSTPELIEDQLGTTINGASVSQAKFVADIIPPAWVTGTPGPTGSALSFYSGCLPTSAPAGNVPFYRGGWTNSSGVFTGLTQCYPFAPQAWSQYNPDGSQTGQKGIPQVQQQAGAITSAIFGDYYQPAGYWPNEFISTVAGSTVYAAPTGLFETEQQWSYDTTQSSPQQVNPYTPNGDPMPGVKATASYKGFIFAMIYCDAASAECWAQQINPDGSISYVHYPNGTDAYFMGRMFRVEPGTVS